MSVAASWKLRPRIIALPTLIVQNNRRGLHCGAIRRLVQACIVSTAAVYPAGHLPVYRLNSCEEANKQSVEPFYISYGKRVRTGLAKEQMSSILHMGYCAKVPATLGCSCLPYIQQQPMHLFDKQIDALHSLTQHNNS